jgi:hypothetical protein
MGSKEGAEWSKVETWVELLQIRMRTEWEVEIWRNLKTLSID